MRFESFLIAFLLLRTDSLVLAQSANQGPNRQAFSRGTLDTFIEDDCSLDSRDEYQVGGKVDWKSGKLGDYRRAEEHYAMALETRRHSLGLPIGDDGILTAEELSGLDLRNTDLVTLSACETGLGDVAAGPGVFGLQRVFHQSGARSVLASLWKVDDQATLALMTEFYNNLWNNKLSKVESLRQAQLAMLERYDLATGKLRGIGTVPRTSQGQLEASERDGGTAPSQLHPRFWAAFQLSGDWR